MHRSRVPVEAEVDERLSRTWAETEDRFVRLKADLAQAELRANRAEQWLALMRREIEDHLMPSLAAVHDQPSVAGSNKQAVAVCQRAPGQCPDLVGPYRL
jgi:hypothetical protein